MKNYSEMAEQTLLGSLFFNNAAIGKVETILNEEHFYVPVYGAMFKAMQTQWQQTAMLSGHKVMQEVRQHPACQSMDELQFNAWAAEILQAGNGTDDLMATASYIVELYNKRYLLQLNAELAMALESGDVAKIEGAKQKIEKATLSTKAKKRQTTEEQIREAFATLQAPDNIMPTGFKIWDDIFGGIAKNARYIIAAHSGAGKTAMAMNIAANIAQRGKKVHFFLFEETKGRLWARIAAMTQMTNMASFRNPAQGLEPAAHDAFIKLFEEFKDKNILFHDNVQSVAEMIDLCGECDLIVIDGMSSFPAPAEFTKVDKAGWVSDQCVKLSKHLSLIHI